MAESRCTRALFLSVTYIVPSASNSRSVGPENRPSREDALVPATFDSKLPATLNSWRRLFDVSATQTSPSASIAIPRGALSWPSPVPTAPHAVWNIPVVLKRWIRLLEVSATKTCPAPSTAIPWGDDS